MEVRLLHFSSLGGAEDHPDPCHECVRAVRHLAPTERLGTYSPSRVPEGARWEWLGSKAVLRRLLAPGGGQSHRVTGGTPCLPQAGLTMSWFSRQTTGPAPGVRAP